jgi:antitoxin HigA-1
MFGTLKSSSISTLNASLKTARSYSPEMAVRLSIAFNTTAESWLSQQFQYDLGKAGKDGSRGA